MVGDVDRVSIDKVVIQGAEFTRVADRYLLQSEVEQALARSIPPQVPHFERLTSLLEDIVSTADSVALEVVEAGAAAVSRAQASGRARGESPDAIRTLLAQIRIHLQEQISLIDSFTQRLEG